MTEICSIKEIGKCRFLLLASSIYLLMLLLPVNLHSRHLLFYKALKSSPLQSFKGFSYLLFKAKIPLHQFVNVSLHALFINLIANQREWNLSIKVFDKSHI